MSCIAQRCLISLDSARGFPVEEYMTSAHQVHPLPRWQAALLYGALPLAAFAAACWLFRHVFHCAPITTDENSYVFQAYNFLAGVIARPLPPLSGLFFHEMIIEDDRAGWLARYPPGHPLWLLPGCLIHQPHLMVALAAALSVGLMARVGALFGRREAWVAAVLLVCSPFFLFTHGTLLGHTSGLLAALLLLYGFLRWQLTAAPGYAVLAGLGWSWLFLNRTYTAMWLALPFGLYALLYLWQRRRDRAAWLGTALFAATACVGIAGILLYNKLSTGHANLMTYLLYDPSEGPGFGLKHLSGTSGVHTLALGLAAFWDNLKLLNHWCLGFSGSLLVCCALALFGWRKQWTPLLLAGPLLAWGGYIAYFYRGPQETGPGYYLEALPCLLLAAALGATRLMDWLRPRKLALAAAAVALVVLGGLDLWFMAVQGRILSDFNAPIGRILACLRAAPPNALVLATEKGNDYAGLHHGLSIYNPQGLDSQPLVVRSVGEGDQLLARAFGNRTPFYLEVNASVARLVPFAPRIPYVSLPVRDFYPANTGQRVLGGVKGDQRLQVARAGRDKDEALAYGIYYVAIPGNFVMDFDVIVSNAPPAQLAVTLDVAMNKGCTSLTRYYLTGDVARVVSLPVHVQRLDFVEPRVFYAGVGDVIFRGCCLREVGPAEPLHR